MLNHMLRGVAALAAAVVSLPASTARAAGPAVLRIGTIAPEGTTWLRELHAMARDIERRTGGAVRVKAYPGAVLGDERAMVRRLSRGELEGAMLTSVGLELAVPAMQVFHVPFLFESPGEVEGAFRALDPILDDEFAKAGLLRMGLGVIGPIRTFGVVPSSTVDAMNKVRLWAWVDEPIQRQYFRIVGLRTVPLSLPDVRAALAANQVDVVYSTAMGVLAFGWFEHVKFMSRETFVQSVGGVVLRRAALDALGPHAAIVREEFETHTAMLHKRLLGEEEQAYRVLLKRGMKETTSEAGVMARLHAGAVELRKRFGSTDMGRKLLEAVDAGRRKARAAAEVAPAAAPAHP